MNLLEFYKEKVKIVDTDGRVFVGKVNDYIDPEDNEDEKESIVVDTIENQAIEFNEGSIRTIEIIS